MKYYPLIGSGLFLSFMGQTKKQSNDLSFSFWWRYYHHPSCCPLYLPASSAGPDYSLPSLPGLSPVFSDWTG
jgi:hypothetical protein